MKLVYCRRKQYIAELAMVGRIQCQGKHGIFFPMYLGFIQFSGACMMYAYSKFKSYEYSKIYFCRTNEHTMPPWSWRTSSMTKQMMTGHLQLSGLATGRNVHFIRSVMLSRTCSKPSATQQRFAVCRCLRRWLLGFQPLLAYSPSPPPLPCWPWHPKSQNLPNLLLGKLAWFSFLSRRIFVWGGVRRGRAENKVVVIRDTCSHRLTLIIMAFCGVRCAFYQRQAQFPAT